MPSPSPARTRKALLVGALVLLVSVAAMFLPLLIRVGEGGKYIVAPALAGLFFGAGVILNAAIDLLRGK